MHALAAECSPQSADLTHRPVMVFEVLDALLTNRHGTYVDSTFGRGGHASALLERLAPDATVVAVDRDPDAVFSAHSLASRDPRVRPVRGCFSRLSELALSVGAEAADGILMDIGVSSPQLNSPRRGFSFLHNGPLDMRMDPSRGASAAEWLNSADGEELERVIRNYGGEIHARSIVRAILSERPLNSTDQLRDLVERTVRVPDHRKHSATRVFQAIRIHVNDELRELDAGLESAMSLLKPGGRLAIISFHSLEHRIVRSRFRSWVRPEFPRKIPLPGRPVGRAEFILKGARPSEREILENRRSRSALLQAVARANG